MALDGITLYSIKTQLKDTLTGGRVDKIYQPEEDLFTIDVWNRADLQLLISTGDLFRIHLSERDFENPARPPAFCMLLRKHLEGGTIREITQPGLDRLIYIKVKRSDEPEKRLIVELMGRRCNVILTKGDEILGALDRKSEKQRDLSTGKEYRRPTPQDKADPREITPEDLSEIKKDTGKLWRSVLSSVEGVGPLLSREIATRAGIDPEKENINEKDLEKILEATKYLGRKVRKEDFDPVVYMEETTPAEFAPFPLKFLSEKKARGFESISKALDFYSRRKEKISKKDRLEELLTSKIKEEKERIESATDNLEEQLNRAENREELKKKGDVLMANLDQIEKGQKEARLKDIFSEEDKELTVQLDPSLNPQKNAEKYYNRYKKLKRGRKKMKKRMRRLKKEKRFILNLEEKLKEADEKKDLEKIHGKLDEKGYFQEPPEEEGEGSGGPREFWVEGHKILAGKNASQNDKLVRQGNKGDLWFHVRDYAGAHVLLDTGGNPDQVPEKAIRGAARIAAYYSKAREADEAMVSYTELKYVDKPKGAKPGLVRIENEKTIVVDPSEV